MWSQSVDFYKEMNVKKILTSPSVDTFLKIRVRWFVGCCFVFLAHYYLKIVASVVFS